MSAWRTSYWRLSHHRLYWWEILWSMRLREFSSIKAKVLMLVFCVVERVSTHYLGAWMPLNQCFKYLEEYLHLERERTQHGRVPSKKWGPRGSIWEERVQWCWVSAVRTRELVYNTALDCLAHSLHWHSQFPCSNGFGWWDCGHVKFLGYCILFLYF